MNIRTIQDINKDRADKWHNGSMSNWSGLEWAGAMCGEAGEAANVTKKLRRIELGLEGNQFSDRQTTEFNILLKQLSDEIADTFLYLTLLASCYGLDLENAIIRRFNTKSEQMGFPERLVNGTDLPFNSIQTSLQLFNQATERGDTVGHQLDKKHNA